MQRKQLNTLAVGRGVQGFEGRHAAALEGVITPTTRSKLDAAVAQLGDYQGEQQATDALIHGETRNEENLRLKVYEDFLKTIGDVARRELRDKPEFPQMNIPSVVVRSAAFVAKATAAVDGASPYESIMVENGLPADFVAKGHAAIAEVTASADARAAHRSRRYTATIGIANADAEVRSLIGLIDGRVTSALKGNRDVLDDWQASKRIKQVPVNPLPTGSVAIGSSTTDGPQSPAPAGPALVQSAPATPTAA
jgi:hypothetical protein